MTLRHAIVSTLALLALLPLRPAAAVPRPAPGDEDRPTIVALRLDDRESVRLDGTLDEALWQRAEPITQFRQQEPREGEPPTEPTEIRVVYDRDNLYIGAIFHDSDPSGILAHQRERNAGLGTDDRFMWILDTFLDGRSGYFFEINPAGLMGDGLMRPGPGSGINKSWNGIWEARVARGPYGWSAEIRIPFRTLNFDPASDTWGINFQRTVRRKNEEILWAGHRRNQGLFQPIHAGRLVGLTDISQGLGLEVKPYVASSWREADGPGGPRATPADVGFDLSYSITPSLRASVTVNTDFAEVEVDQRQVNLTRFPISYPERRDFFLEGSGVFSFAPVNGITPYFSRRIGLVQGEPVPILYGARLAGQVGASDVGVYQVRTGGQGLLPGEDFTAARLVRNIFRQSSIGAIYTRRSTEGLALDGGTFDQHTLGSDLELATNRFLGNKNLNFQAVLALHSARLADDTSSVADRTARGMRLTYPNDPFRWHVSYREFGTHFDPPVGFTPRRGFRRLQPTVGYTHRLAGHPLVRQLDFSVEHQYLMDMDFRPLTVTTDVTFLGVRLHSGDRLELGTLQSRERLDRGFPIQTGVVIPPSEYAFRQWKVEAQSAGFRRVSGSLTMNNGEFWSGNRTQTAMNLTVRPLPGVNVGTTWEHNDVRLREGDFVANLVRLSAGWHMNPWTSLTGNVQYDNLSDLVGLYGRFRWTTRPGSDFFLVYSHNWRNFDDRFLTLNRAATTKLTYTQRF
jgi:hypothetical protein